MNIPDDDIGIKAIKHVMANEIIIQALKNLMYTLFRCMMRLGLGYLFISYSTID